VAKLAIYGDLSSGFTRFLAFGEDKNRFEVPVQRKRSLEALARFGGKALDDASLPVHRQLRQLLVREALACHAAEKRQPAIGIRAFGTSGIEDQ
jgi:hypothetical protein